MHSPDRLYQYLSGVCFFVLWKFIVSLEKGLTQSRSASWGTLLSHLLLTGCEQDQQANW